VSWINDNKGKGMWKSGAQGAKTEYNEGDQISSLKDPVWQAKTYTGVKSIPITDTHMPCGYWDKWMVGNCGNSGYQPEGSEAYSCACDDNYIVYRFTIDKEAQTVDPLYDEIAKYIEEIVISKGTPSVELAILNTSSDCTYTWAVYPMGDYTDPVVVEEVGEIVADGIMENGASAVYYPPLRVGAFDIITRINGVPCWKRTVIIVPACENSAIGYGITTMPLGTMQTLTVTSPVEGAVYAWDLLAGLGTLHKVSDYEATYEAPETNPYCESNPVIALKIVSDFAEITCDTITIALTAGSGLAGFLYSSYACYGGYRCYEFYYPFYCDGYQNPIQFSGPCNDIWTDCGIYDEIPPGYDHEKCTSCPSPGSVKDLRSEEQKSAGCCPEQLL